MTSVTGRQVALALIVLLVSAGCGDDAESPEPDSSTPELPATTAPTAEPSTAATSPTGPTTTGATLPPSGDGPDLCTLFENLDVADLLGEEPGEPRGDGVRCVIDSAATDSTAEIAVGVREQGQAAFVQARELLGFDSELEGLGDEAFVSGAWIHVLAGERYIDLEVIRNPLGSAPQPTEDELVAAMRTVLTNLGMDV